MPHWQTFPTQSLSDPASACLLVNWCAVNMSVAQPSGKCAVRFMVEGGWMTGCLVICMAPVFKRSCRCRNLLIDEWISLKDSLYTSAGKKQKPVIWGLAGHFLFLPWIYMLDDLLCHHLRKRDQWQHHGDIFINCQLKQPVLPQCQRWYLGCSFSWGPLMQSPAHGDSVEVLNPFFSPPLQWWTVNDYSVYCSFHPKPGKPLQLKFFWIISTVCVCIVGALVWALLFVPFWLQLTSKNKCRHCLRLHTSEC